MSQKIAALKASALLRECGTRAKYSAGCRCFDCKRANTEYEKARAKARKEGDWNGLIDAKPVRLHLKALSRKGIGTRTICEYTGLGRTLVTKVKSGQRLKIRKRNADLLLAVDTSCITGGTLISAKPVWRDIDWLLNEGFTRAEIAKRLGYKMPSLQIGKKKVTGRTRVKVQRLVGKLRLGE
jgi:hypothetical protein